ncbi:DNA mismatch endonuclease Vsr [Clostridium sp. AF18-27]|uniref:very short patch repair endonuclease n=1 Tax=Enterocloster lavalensis TaxID=460384 RepID=UPI000E4ECD27|nr:very short patch repair endonuclease [Enterocloster lavalensis]RHR56393.1 DNA mismatch endonuclease Vsr [Clostridium sp. AF18-27]
MDVHDKKTRSYNMSRICGKDTKPEEIVCKYLFSKGFRYRKNDKRLPGKPDIVLPKYKTVVFVNGCFWHKHEDCKYFVWPKSNPEFWKDKIERTVERDKEKIAELIASGWHVFVIWECQLKPVVRETTLQGLCKEIKCLYTVKDLHAEYQSSMGVIEWQGWLMKELPDDLQCSLSLDEKVEKERE